MFLTFTFEPGYVSFILSYPQLHLSFHMERIKLNFTHDQRTIGILSTSDDGENVYTPVILWNFKVVGYISGPRPAPPNRFVGYKLHLFFTEGEETEVVINHNSINTFKTFTEALRLGTHGLIFTFNPFDESLWPDLWSRLYYHCTETKICRTLRPADNIGIQYKFLEEMQESKGHWNDSDYEEVYSDRVLDAMGKEKEKPIHIYVPELTKKAKVLTPAFLASGLEGFMEMLNPPYTHHNPEIRTRQILALMAAGPLRYYRFIVDQVTKTMPNFNFLNSIKSIMLHVGRGLPYTSARIKGPLNLQDSYSPALSESVWLL